MFGHRIDGYGSNPVALWLCDMRDRLDGRAHRARARWGHLRAPEGTGKLIWVRAGSSRRSVRLGAEIVAALREKRRDVRLILTYHTEYPDILAARLGGLAKTGFGYGPADAPRAVKRVLNRLQPLGVICVEDTPGRFFLDELGARHLHAIQLQGVYEGSAGLEAHYPHAENSLASVEPAYRAPAADLLTLITPSQVDPVFGSLLKGNNCTDIWWVHAPADTHSWLNAWAASPLCANSVLAISQCGQDFEGGIRTAGLASVRASAWQREAVAAGTLWIMDEERWMPALAASVSGVWLSRKNDRETYWQALAGGAPLLTTKDAMPTTVLAAWQALQADPQQARRCRDESRRRFWDERRRAGAVLEEFLQRVYDW